MAQDLIADQDIGKNVAGEVFRDDTEGARVPSSLMTTCMILMAFWSAT